jgi:TolB-like protein
VSPGTDPNVLLPPTDDRPAIAVLPFDDLSSDPGNAYLASGIQAELSRRMGLIGNLLVISGTSSLSHSVGEIDPREIADDLGAKYLVAGTVQAETGRLRIRVQLVDGDTGNAVWSEDYDDAFEAIVELESRVAEAIAQDLGIRILPEESGRLDSRPTGNLAAYELYLRSTELREWVREENAAAVELLRQATQLDPEFAVAHARLAWQFHFSWMLHGTPYAVDSAQSRALRAIALDSEVPDAHTALGFSVGHEGGPHYRRAVEINPSDGLGWALLGAIGWFTGDHVGGAIAARRGVRVAPKEPEPAYHLASCLALIGMYDEASQWYDVAARVDPAGFRFTHVGPALVHLWRGEVEAASRQKDSMLAMGGDNALALYTAALIDLVAGDLENSHALLTQSVRIAPKQAPNGLPTAEVLSAWVGARLDSGGDRSQLERLRRERIQEVDRLLADVSGNEPANFSHQLALALAGRYNDLTVISSGLGEVEDQTSWFLKAGALDRMNFYYHSLRLTPWVKEIAYRPEVRSWVQEKERQMAIQRLELESLGVHFFAQTGRPRS